jgi:H+-transporting ATPase
MELTCSPMNPRLPGNPIKPAAALFWSAVLTKVLATFVAVYGWYVTPIGWNLALFVWGYALAAFVVTDFLKVRLSRAFEHTGLIFHR